MEENLLVKEVTAHSKKASQSVELIYKAFHSNMESVNYYFIKFGNLASGEDETIISNQNVIIQNILDSLNSEIKRLKQKRKDPENEEEKVDADYQTHNLINQLGKKITKHSKIPPKNYEVLSRGSFLMLNNYFEYLLVDLLTYYYTKFQGSLNNKEFKVSLQELSEYETIEEITNHVILKEVETILIEKTFEQLLEHFEKVLKVSLDNELIDWSRIIEIRERRHLIVHNSSLVNKKYITRTKNPYNLKIGDTVHITDDYFNSAFNQLDIAGKILSLNSWGNWDGDNATNAIEQIMIVSYDNLVKKDFEMTLKYCTYSNRIEARNSKQQDILLRIQINKAIALKKLNKKSELLKFMKTLPIGTAAPIFKVAFQILNDEEQSLFENIKKAILVEELTLENYLDWPIFDFVRENDINDKILTLFNVAPTS